MRHRHPIALAHLTAIEVSPPRLVDAAAAAGFGAVTLRLLPAGPRDAVFPLITDRRLRDQTLSRLRHHGCGVLDVEAVLIADASDAHKLQPALEVAAALGARHLLVVGEHADRLRLAEALHALCARASPLALRPMLEFIPFTPVATLEQAVAVVEAAQHPAAGVLVDPLHLRRSGGSPAQVEAVVRARPELFPYAQLCDAPLGAPAGGDRGLYREAVTDRLLPGEGELPLDELLVAYPPDLPLSVETPVSSLGAVAPEERIARVGHAVRAWLEDRDGLLPR